MNASRPRRFSFSVSAFIVAIVGVVITAALAIGARSVHDANEQRLLRQRVQEAAAVAASAFETVQIPLSSAAVLAEATNADPASFRGLMQPIVKTGRPFESVSIWSTSATSQRPLVVVGVAPELAAQPAAAVRALLQRAANGTVALNDLLGTQDRRLGYALAASKQAKYVVYGEAALPRDRRANIDKNSAFADLDYALFAGTTRDPNQLLASSTGGARLKGRTASAAVPFGDSQLLVDMSPRNELGGSLLARLWWLLVLLGLVLTVAATALVERLSLRRLQAEDLAQENANLYATQRSVALTLQHSLLTDDFPQISGVEIGARYVAGVEGIDIGGDWYDVIGLDENRVMIAVGDVSGRGLQAATAMASLRFAIRAYAAQGDAPGAILTKLSELVSIGRDGHFATALCATVDVAERVITCANAGHLEPLLIDGDTTEFVATAVGLPVGVRSGTPYSETTHPLPANGTLLFYTDGLVERRGENLSDGLARLARATARTEGSLEHTLTSILEHAIPDASTDDTALLGVRWDR